MPLYDFRCKECETVFEVMCSISAKDDLHECPHCKSESTESIIGRGNYPVIDSVRLGIKKPDQGFREVMARVHEKNPHSRIKDNVNW